LLLHGKQDEELKRVLAQHWGVALWTSPFSILWIPEDYDATFGANWAIVLVGLDREHTHSWDSFGGVLEVLALGRGKDIHHFHAD
jgi:hypothetical protein